MILIWAGSGNAQGQGLNQLLKGHYAFSGEGTCIVSPTDGFNPDLTPIDPVGRFVVSFSVQGVRTFNGDGTGTMRARTVNITHSDVAAVLGGGSSTNIVSSFTYQFAADGTVSTLLSAPLTGTVLTGPRTGQTFTIDQFPLSGLVSKDRRTLTLASVTPAVEVVTYSNGDVQHRLCHRSRIHFLVD
jgi:hypothetical protein